MLNWGIQGCCQYIFFYSSSNCWKTSTAIGHVGHDIGHVGQEYKS